MRRDAIHQAPSSFFRLQIIISNTNSILTTSNLRLLDAVAGVDAMRMNPAMIATSALPLGIPSPETISDDRRSTFNAHKQINWQV